MITKFRVRCGGDERQVWHFWYDCWPARCSVFFRQTFALSRSTIGIHACCWASSPASMRCYRMPFENPFSYRHLLYAFHHTTLQDHGVPVDTTHVVTILKTCRQWNDVPGQPWVVHCSAGIGRTGSFIAVDHGPCFFCASGLLFSLSLSLSLPLSWYG
jgi:protein tyrosine phosphatase